MENQFLVIKDERSNLHKILEVGKKYRVVGLDRSSRPKGADIVVVVGHSEIVGCVIVENFNRDGTLAYSTDLHVDYLEEIEGSFWSAYL